MEPTLESAPEPVRGPRLQTVAAVVVRRIQETPDTVTLVLDTGSFVPPYRAGQFVTIDPHQFPALGSQLAFLEQLKGKREPTRAYSLASAPDEPTLSITIKEEKFEAGQTAYPPLLSPYLVHAVQEGQALAITGCSGHYVLPHEVDPHTLVVHLCAGSGIVPSFSILKDDLSRPHGPRHVLLYSNKTCRDAIFAGHLAALAERHPERFTLVHAYTRETDDAIFCEGIRRGRVNRGLIEEFVPRPHQALYYVCGPAISPWERKAAKARGEAPTPRFLDTVVSLLAELGVDRRKITREAYG